MLTRFAFTFKTNTVAGIHTRRDFHGQGFRTLYAAMTVAFAARIFNDLTASLTGRTRLLNREEALTHLNLARTVAGRTGGRELPAFAPLPWQTSHSSSVGM